MDWFGIHSYGNTIGLVGFILPTILPFLKAIGEFNIVLMNLIALLCDSNRKLSFFIIALLLFNAFFALIVPCLFVPLPDHLLVLLVDSPQHNKIAVNTFDFILCVALVVRGVVVDDETTFQGN